jgi:hypothetical protein
LWVQKKANPSVPVLAPRYWPDKQKYALTFSRQTPQPCTQTTIDGNVFLFCNYLQTFDEAETACQSQGAHLASIDSPSQGGEVFLAAWNAYLFEASKNGEPATRPWIGLTDRGHTGTFAWINGTSLAAPMWKSSYPNNTPMADCGRFAYELPWVTSDWVNVDCTEKRTFICRR